MKIKKSFAIYSGLAILVLIGSVVYYTFRPSLDSVENLKPDYILSAKEIVTAFEEDETAANTLYLDKVLLVSGSVAEIAGENEEMIIVYIEGSVSGNVSCLFTNDLILKTELKVGEQISVKGKCTGYIFDVVLTKCSLQNN